MVSAAWTNQQIGTPRAPLAVLSPLQGALQGRAQGRVRGRDVREALPSDFINITKFKFCRMDKPLAQAGLSGCDPDGRTGPPQWHPQGPKLHVPLPSMEVCTPYPLHFVQ
ncbi:hypothetical protein CB1_000325014 [Camelus ferus]|nr:hypothetical protein CB1_000325014 [Camelus ferus]